MVQQQFVDEHLVREVNQGKPRLSIVVAVFIGYRVSVLSFECGGRTYSVGPAGSVVAGDSARSRFELRCCSGSSTHAVGNDADRVEFRFRDSNNRIDLKCSRTSVPGTGLTVSHISGSTFIKTIQSVRENRARVGNHCTREADVAPTKGGVEAHEGSTGLTDLPSPFWGSGFVPQGAQFFVEVFAGEAELTQAIIARGMKTRPPY